MRSISKALAIPMILVLGALTMPSAALATGTCGEFDEIVLGAHPGKLAQYDVNGDGIICPAPAKVIGKHAKPGYQDNTPAG
jgi:hypothetical protein